MTNDKIDRIRSVDVENLSDEELERYINTISDKINLMVDDTCSKANKLLNIYGMEAKMTIVLQKRETDKE